MPQRVTCIGKRGECLDPHRRISQIGGVGWSISERGAIAILKRDLNAFYLETLEGTVFLVVRIDDGREYLTTEADGIVPASLLALPECA
jgi:hypothetical protein